MFVDLEQGAVAVVKSVGQETSQTVGHKYGEDAGHVTKDSMAAASDAAILAGVSDVCVCVGGGVCACTVCAYRCVCHIVYMQHYITEPALDFWGPKKQRPKINGPIFVNHIVWNLSYAHALLLCIAIYTCTSIL